MRSLHFLICLSSISLSVVSQDRAIFDKTLNAGYEALAQTDYDRALKFLEEVQKSPVLQQEKEKNLKMYIDEVVRLTKKRKELGRINPTTIHKAVVLYVSKVEGMYENDKKERIAWKEEMSNEDIRVAKWHEGVVKQMYEAMSNCNFTIDFDHVIINEPLHSIRLVDLEPWPDWDNYDAAADIIKQNFDNHDTFIWCTTMIHNEAHGGYGRFPLGQGRLTPQKGFIELNPKHSVNIWIHEFFHIVEGMVGISPSHGHHKQNKDKFPDWPGKADNELDYYSWQFSTTIPAKGWETLKIKSKLSDEDPGDPIENLDEYTNVGSWTASQITNEWKVGEWKMEVNEIPSGVLKIMMLYTNGWKALDIEWVSLWHNGNEIAKDEHMGFSGTKKHNIVYRFDVPKKLKGSFIIKAKIKGDNGTDSNGKVLMKLGKG